MRIIIGAALGLIAGLLCLVQFMGWLQWLPTDAFTKLHTPSLVVVHLLVPDQWGRAAIPFTMVAQWLSIGTLIGAAAHLVHRSKWAK